MVKLGTSRSSIIALQGGGFNLLSLAITATLMIFLIVIVSRAFFSGDWIIVKWMAGIWVGLMGMAFILSSIEDLGFSRKKKAHFEDLQRYLDVAQGSESSAKFEETERQILNSEAFSINIKDGADDLLRRYKSVRTDRLDNVRRLLLRSIPYSLEAFEEFLASPINDEETRNYLRGWLGCRRDDLAPVVSIFQRTLSDDSRLDGEFLATLVLWVLPHFPDEERCALLEPLFPYLEKFRSTTLDKDELEVLNRYTDFVKQSSE